MPLAPGAEIDVQGCLLTTFGLAEVLFVVFVQRIDFAAETADERC